MALDYAKTFYNSKEWRDLRRYICISRNWTCEECGGYGNQVHHIEEITPSNINEPNITLNESNLQLLCERCHNGKRKKESDIEEGLMFDEFGNLIRSPLSNKNMYATKTPTPPFQKTENEKYI